MTPATAEKTENYFVDGMPNAEYHNPELGVSTSTLKLFMECPSLVLWNAAADRDESKMGAINFGTDFHSYFLEPAKFCDQHKVLPTFNRRKAAEKQEEIELIDEWRNAGITAVKAEDMDKLKAMSSSAMSHPTVSQVMLMKGVAERSFFWIDPDTGLLCKCRPDLLIENITADSMPIFMQQYRSELDKDKYTHLIVDYKTIGKIDRVQAQIEEYKYYIQAEFYRRGVEAVTGGKALFLFVFVSTSLSMGRYPVKTYLLNDTARFDGNIKIEDALRGYAELAKKPQSHWCTAQVIDRPHWAVRDDENSETGWAS